MAIPEIKRSQKDEKKRRTIFKFLTE